MKIILPKEIKLPKEINIDIDLNTCKHINKDNSKDYSDSEIRGRRNVFSGEDFKL